MIGAILLLAAAAAADNGEFPTFRDWTAGCDNGRSCMAVGQYNPANFELASVVVERGPLASDVPKIWFRSDGGPVIDLQADGKRLGVKLIDDAENDAFIVDRSSVPSVVEALKSARSLIPVRGDGEPSFPLSVSGASAAMRWIDEQQRRVGTVTALVARGPAPASSVPAPPPLPVVKQAVPSGVLGKPLTKEEVAAIQEEHAECTDEELDDKVQYGRIDERTTLAIVTAVCGSGAYNYYGIPLLLRDDGTRKVADLDRDEEGDLTMNLSWDEKTRVLSSYFKGRGLGDCGDAKDWVWDGTRFRVVLEKAMGECQGAIAWIPYYRAKVVTK